MKGLRIYAMVLAAGALIGLTGCCARAPGVGSTQMRDSLVVERSVEYIERMRDTVIYVVLPQESAESETLRDNSFLQTSAAISTAAVRADGSLYHTLRNKPGPIAADISLPERETVILEMRSATSVAETEVPVARKMSRFEKFLCGSGLVFWGILLAAAIWFLVRLFK